MNGVTIGERLEAVNFRPSGFDYMRIILCVMVVFWHSFDVTDGGTFMTAFIQTPGRGLHAVILPMFFALSGFLVAGSLLRCRSLISFLGLRGIRIFPALAVETISSAIVIGVIFTTLPLHEYFLHEEFRLYLLNALGIIHYSLPGVFADNPIQGLVNLQLWTVPFELECYVALSILAILGVVRRREWALVAALGIVALDLATRFYAHGFSLSEPLDNGVRGRELVSAFICGVTVFLYKDRIPYNATLGWVATIVGYGLLITPNYGDALAVIPIAYVTAWLGLMNPVKIFVLKGADYSYGIYLYGFAIQQAVQSTLPQLNWIGNLTISLLVVSVISALSWIYIEKPAIALRPALMRFEDRILNYVTRAKRNFYGILIAHNPVA